MGCGASESGASSCGAIRSLVAIASGNLLRRPCSHATCSDCAQEPGCGWCAERHVCMQGGDDGPCNADECAVGMWMPRTCTASGVACGVFSNCNDCALNEDCGWCASDGRRCTR